MAANQLEQLAALLSNAAPQSQTQPLYNQLVSGGQVPLDHPAMMQANPALAASLLMPQLEQVLAQGDMQGAQALYNQLAQTGEVPLDDPTMLRANPALSASLGLVGQPAPTPQEQLWEMPSAPVAKQAPSQLSALWSMLTSNAIPAGLYEENPARSTGEQVGRAVAYLPKMLVNQIGALPENLQTLSQKPEVVDGLGGLLYGMFGDSLMPSAQPTAQPQPMAIPQQAPAPMQQAPAPAQPAQQVPQAPVVQQAPVAQPTSGQQAPAATPQDVVAALMGQPSDQAGVATPQDVLGALNAQPAAQAPEQSWYQRPEFLQYVGDVLTGVAADDNWARGIAQGNMRNEQRKLTGQKTAQENMLAQAQLAKMMSETQKNTVDAQVAGHKAMKESDPDSLDNQKTAAEIARIKAEQTLAEVRAMYVGQEKSFTDNNYAQAYADVLKSEQEGYMMDPENPAYLFGPDFSARYKLNTISPNVARYYPMDGKTKQVLDSSMQQLQSGEITKEEFDSRLYQAQYVHGPESIRKYISGASNATTKPK